jgi:hypothetical protein
MLADSWLSDTNIDMMYTALSSCMEADNTLDACVIIETMRVMQDLNKAKSAEDHSKPMTVFLQRLEHRIKKDGEGATLLFPVHLKRAQHWIAVRVDFGDKTWCYGKSQSPDETRTQKD